LGIYFAIEANVNTGIITIIWRSAIFITALLDYLLNGTKLKYFHWIGLASCMLCTVLLGVSKIGGAADTNPLAHHFLPVWIPLVLSIS